MPRFEGYIYGDIPVEGECTTDGDIVDVMVTGLVDKRNPASRAPVYLDFSEEERQALQVKLAKNISEAIADWYRQVRQEKKHGR